ncbi:MAG: hypothetical protein JWR52_2665, partial [Marmoricola sp.]|nr:hypothetical protein [Marmoricola sp.]
MRSSSGAPGFKHLKRRGSSRLGHFFMDVMALVAALVVLPVRMARRARVHRALAVAGALALLVLPLHVVDPAAAYQLPTSGAGASITYPSGVTVTGSQAGPGGKSISASSTDFGCCGYGYVASDYTPAPPNGSPGITPWVPGQAVTASCPAYGLCPNLGTFTFTFSRPVRNPRMHLDELGGAVGSSTNGVSTLNATSTRLTLTTPGVTMAVASGRNLSITGGNTIEATNKAMNLSCSTGAPPPPGCGTVAFTGVVTSLTFNVSSFTALVSGPPISAHGPDGFPVSFTFDEDFGDAPASYDQGNAASAVISDLTLGPGISADNTNVANAVVDPNAGPTATNDTFDDGVTLGTLTAADTTYSTTVAINAASAAGTACGWIDFNKNGVFDNPGERACSTFAAGATSATLTWSGLSGLTTGPTYARFRIGYNAAQTQSPTGPSDAGEVEDYALTIAPAPNPSVKLVKTASTNTLVAGQTITYTFTATNTGNTNLTGVTISEGAFTGSGSMSGLTCLPSQPATLAPNATLVCTATYVVSQADVDAGKVTNAAGVTGNPPTGPPVTDTSQVTVPGTSSPAIVLTKTPSSATYVVGTPVTYTFKATNTGNVTLSGVTIS